MKLRMSDGTEVEQGGPEDRATWWTCTRCFFTGPHVGTDEHGQRACMGVICRGVALNPNVLRLPNESAPR